MITKENIYLTTFTILVKSLRGNWHVYFPAHQRCSSLNRVTILPRRALLDKKINAPLTPFNHSF